MIKIAVVIPFFQTEAGLLRRAVSSVLNQRLSSEIVVEIFVVDDGSPVTADSELLGLALPAAFRLNVQRKKNGGVASARNAALEKIDKSFRYVAFLDSDDTWYAAHLATGIDALEKDRDFYFCNNCRTGHYANSFLCNGSFMKEFLKNYPDQDKVIDIPAAQLVSMNLRDFVTHPQGAIFRRAIAPDLLFDTEFRNAGEDFVYFMNLLGKAKRSCFSSQILVECGRGINIYYNSFNWDSDSLLQRLIDEMRSRLIVLKTVSLSKEDQSWLKENIALLRRDMAFHFSRYFIKHNGHWPPQLKVMGSFDKSFYLWFPVACLQVTVGKVLKTYEAR